MSELAEVAQDRKLEVIKILIEKVSEDVSAENESRHWEYRLNLAQFV